MGAIVVLGLVLAVTYLTARGYDPQPVVQLAGTAVAALAAVGTFVQNLATRRTTTKVERNTGTLAAGVVQVVDQLEHERGRHAAPAADPPPPALEEPEEDLVVPIPGRVSATQPHPFYSRLRPPDLEHGAAPAAEGR